MKHNDEYVTQEIAERLKSLGFAVPCIARWEKRNFVMNHLANYYNHNGGEIKQGWISAPTYFSALKWLRDKNIIVVVDMYCPDSSGKFDWYYEVSIPKEEDFGTIDDFNHYDSYEKAMENGVLAAIKYLEENK